MIPTAAMIRDYLEGYDIDATVISDAWIEDQRDGFVIPAINKMIRSSLVSVKEVTEYYSGNGGSVLVLNRRPINEIVNIGYVSSFEIIYNMADAMEIDYASGILKLKSYTGDGASATSRFSKGEKNVKVTYTYGYTELVDGEGERKYDLEMAVKLWVAKMALNQIGARTGGGSISQQNWGRNFGPLGKYSDIIKQMDTQIYQILAGYKTGVIGG